MAISGGRPGPTAPPVSTPTAALLPLSNTGIEPKLRLMIFSRGFISVIRSDILVTFFAENIYIVSSVDNIFLSRLFCVHNILSGGTFHVETCRLQIPRYCFQISLCMNVFCFVSVPRSLCLRKLPLSST